MKLTWHIVAKDIRRLWLPIALWALVVLARFEVGVLLLRGDGTSYNTFDLLQTVGGFLLGLDTFIHVVLAAMLVQGDAVVGTKGFWMTRPISGPRLLGAKLLGALLVFGALPVLLSLRWWLVCGYGAGEIARAALVTLDGQMALSLAVIMLAALTENLKQFLGAALAALAAAGAMFALLTRQYWIYLERDDRLPMTTATQMSGLIILAGLALGLGHQFRTRQTRQSLAYIGAFYAAAAFMLPLWRWDWSQQQFGTSRPEVAGISVEVATASAELRPMPDWRTLTMHYRINGLSDELTLRGHATGTLRWPDGRSVSRAQPVIAQSREAAERHALRLDAVPVAVTGRGYRHLGTRFPLPEQDINRLRRETASFLSDLTLSILRPVQMLALPLAVGSIVESHGYTLRVNAVRRHDGASHYRLVESRPFRGGAVYGRPGFHVLFGRRPTEAEIAYRIVDRTHQTVTATGPGAMQTTIGSQVVRWSGLSVQPASEFEGATLRLLRYDPISRIRRQVVTDSLSVTFSK